MAKIIEFIAPVEAMRGDLSGGEKLRYGTNGESSAFAAPGPAKNYGTKYIGNRQIVFGNKKGFAVKRRSTFTSASKEPCAVLGGAASLADNAYRNLSLTVQIQQVYEAARAAGKTAGYHLKGYLTKVLMPQLKAKNATLHFAEGSYDVAINNPWISGGTGTDVTIPAEVVTKFTPQLGGA